MCGIVGMFLRRNTSFQRTSTYELKKMFSHMLVEAQVRGASATGVMMTCYEQGKPKVYIARSPLAAEEFVKTEEYKELIDKIGNSTVSVVGHTRAPSGNAATAADNKNNHPFVNGPIIGVHNGRVANDKEIWRAIQDVTERKSACDSEALFGLIDAYVRHNGLPTEEAIRKAILMTYGWAAVAVVDAREPNKLYIYRDKQSPLEMYTWGWSEMVFFASEKHYMDNAIKEAKITQTTSLKRVNVDPNRLFVFDAAIKGSDYNKFFARSIAVEEDEAKKKKVIEENKDSYNTTQGK